MKFPLSILLLLLYILPLSIFAGDNSNKNVLLISSSKASFAQYHRVINSFLETLNSESSSCFVDIFLSDTSEDSFSESDIKRLGALRGEIEKGKYAVLVTIGSCAENYLAENEKIIPDSVSIVRVGTTNLDKKCELKNSVSIIQHVSAKSNIELVKRLFPNRKKIIFITNWTPKGKLLKKEAMQYAAADESINYLFPDNEKISTEELFKYVEANSEGAAIIFQGWYNKKGMNFATLNTLLSHLGVNHSIPLFVMYDSMLHFEVFGGDVFQGSRMGQLMAESVLKILDGTPVSKMQDITLMQKTFVNWEKLAFYGVEERLLPDDAVILNRPPTIWDRHRYKIIIFTGLLSLILVGAFLFFWGAFLNIRRWRGVLKSLPGRIGVINVNEKVLFLSESAMKGRKATDDLFLKDFKNIDYEKISAAVKQVFDTGKIRVLEYENGAAQRAVFIAPIPKHFFGERAIVWFSHNNSELQFAKKNAQENLELLKTTFKCIGDTVITTDVDGKITMMNPVAEKITGFSFEEAKGLSHESVFKIFDGEGQNKESPISLCIKSGAIVKSGTASLRPKEGKNIHISNNTAPILDARGKLTGTISVFCDISREFSQREELKSTFLQLEMGTKLTMSASFVFNSRTLEICGSSLLPELLPIKDGRLLLMRDWIFADDMKNVREAWNCLYTKKTKSAVFNYRTKSSGYFRYFRVHIVAGDNPDKSIFTGVIQDITDIKTTSALLETQLNLWDACINSLSLLFFVKNADENYRYVICNDAFAKRMGLAKEEIIGKTDAELLNAVEFKNSRETDERVMKNPDGEQVREFFTDCDGIIHAYMTAKKPFIGMDGSRLLLGASSDITEINSFLPPSVIVDSAYNILYSIGTAGTFMRLPKGQMTANLLKMLPNEISVAVSSLIRRSEKKAGEIVSTEVQIQKKQLNLFCKHIVTPEEEISCYYVSFEEKPIKETIKEQAVNIPIDLNNQYKERIEELEREIQHKNESLQATVEELETSNEELQSSNEELIASNEELQSTNEELQSVNEELYTVNAEHLRKIDEMTELNSDYDNLLNNTRIGTLFLDKNMVIRKVSKVASNITNILESDIGRPIHHLALSSLYPEFMNDIDKVNESQTIIEHRLPFGGTVYFMRIVPYRTKDRTTKGIIITFVEFADLGDKTIVSPAKKSSTKKN